MIDAVRAFQQACDETAELLPRVREMGEVIEAIAALMVGAWDGDGKILIAGNGGSAADAIHFAEELTIRYKKDRRPLAAISLTDGAALTCAGNDYGFERVFSRQVEALGQPGDVLLAISTSGNSPNCLRALERARALSLTTIAFTGNGGGKMASLADINVIVPCSVTMNIQESQLALEHIFCMLVERCCFGPDFGS
jgi:D-sedoheptulose 7-phosphate isomerase